MAKGGSVSAAEGLEGQEVAGEYRRSVAAVDCRGGAGTEDPAEAASVGERGTGSSVRRLVQPDRRSPVLVVAWLGDSSARHRRRRRGEATYRLVRYADDFVVLLHGTKAHAERLREQAAAVLAPMGLRLSAEKTRICHIDEGFDFLGFRVQRQPSEAAAS
jgi:hypothetical protein